MSELKLCRRCRRYVSEFKPIQNPDWKNRTYARKEDKMYCVRCGTQTPKLINGKLVEE